MINEAFQGRLTRFGTKATKDGDVVAEFTVTHKSEQSSQHFLDSLAEEFHNNVDKCMDYTEWKNIVFDLENVHLHMTFDDVEDMEMPCELKTIRINRREKEGDETYTYNLVFQKILNPNVDSVFATTYLNRKDEDPETGKTSIVFYDILLENK